MIAPDHLFNVNFRLGRASIDQPDHLNIGGQCATRGELEQDGKMVIRNNLAKWTEAEVHPSAIRFRTLAHQRRWRRTILRLRGPAVFVHALHQ